MIEIKTESGFSYSLPEARVKDNRELLDALVGWLGGKDGEATENWIRIPKLLLGADGYAALCEYCRDEDGIVLSSKVDSEIKEILRTQELVKN